MNADCLLGLEHDSLSGSVLDLLFDLLFDLLPDLLLDWEPCRDWFSFHY
jgi:hypothetical protein